MVKMDDEAGKEKEQFEDSMAREKQAGLEERRENPFASISLEMDDSIANPANWGHPTISKATSIPEKKSKLLAIADWGRSLTEYLNKALHPA